MPASSRYEKVGQSWLAAYLYYNEPWEQFLGQAVAPFVRQMLTQGLVRQYFFIRYWEKGPHVRLRFKGVPQVLEEQVRPALVAHFSAYMAAHPSARPEPAWLAGVPAAQQWYPNNSVQFIAYEPETERYGGEYGILVAERQFQASSEAVLAVLQEKGDWDYGRALGTAIQLHLGFAFALGMDLPETVAFFAQVFRNWLPRAYALLPQHLPTEALLARRQEVLKAFAHTYEQQKPVLLPLFRQVWQALENGQAFEQNWYNQWLQSMQGIQAELGQLQAADQLLTSGGYTGPAPDSLLPARQQRWLIYDSYIHMTNNRLGILNRDEGYLGFLIKEGLAEMALAVI